MRSAFRTVCSRCAMTNVVRPYRSRSSPSNTSRSLDVESGRRLVHDHDRRVAHPGPRDADPLPLASRERLSPLAHHRVVPIRERLDELVRLREPGRGDDFLPGRVRLAVGDVLPHRGMGELGLLQDEADLSPERAEGESADVLAVDRDVGRAG